MEPLAEDVVDDLVQFNDLQVVVSKYLKGKRSNKAYKT